MRVPLMIFFFLCIIGLYSTLFGQESSAQKSATCEQELKDVREQLVILQDQHSMITIPRAESDQRSIIALRRQLEQANMKIKQYDEQKNSLQKESP